ncbi:MAG TPA: hypothetical protein ENI95_00290 [Chloroflexi bacterium]|nr:hypothetical protein [Chloroflexota bacterium]
MKHHSRLAVGLGVALIGLGLAACAHRQDALDISSLLVQAEVTRQASPPLLIAEETPTPQVFPVTPTPETDENCLTCHTDQEALKALAVEEEVESLSSGEG